MVKTIETLNEKLLNILKKGRIENKEEADIFADNSVFNEDADTTSAFGVGDEILGDFRMVIYGFCFVEAYGRLVNDSDNETIDINQDLRFFEFIDCDFCNNGLTDTTDIYDMGEDISNPFVNVEISTIIEEIKIRGKKMLKNNIRLQEKFTSLEMAKKFYMLNLKRKDYVEEIKDSKTFEELATVLNKYTDIYEKGTIYTVTYI